MRATRKPTGSAWATRGEQAALRKDAHCCSAAAGGVALISGCLCRGADNVLPLLLAYAWAVPVCSYRDVTWLRKERRWPPALVDSLQAFLQLKSI